VTEASDAASVESRYSADLVRRIVAGDRSAEAAMVERYGRALLFLLRRRTRDDDLAQDFRQEAFRIAVEKLRAGPIENPERLGAYLRGVAVNLVSANWRRSDRQATAADTDMIEAMAGDDPGPFDDISRAQVTAAVRKLLEELTVERDREILVRLYLRDQDRDEICRALGLDSVHFNRVLFRARQRFKALLMQSGETPDLRAVK